MPCYEVREMRVEFQAEHFGILEIALKKMGFNVQKINGGLEFKDFEYRPVRIDNGRITAPTNFDVDSVKRAYSEEIIKTASKRFGWTVKSANSVQKKFTIKR